ncbi:hypothetical protein Q8F81_26885, partial [Klebsiella pneumoniae]|nr:hypothetical protein [Klebsiella pneumoniae]
AYDFPLRLVGREILIGDRVLLLYPAGDLAPFKLRNFIVFAPPALRQALLRIAGAV